MLVKRSERDSAAGCAVYHISAVVLLYSTVHNAADHLAMFLQAIYLLCGTLKSRFSYLYLVGNLLDTEL